eukprot:Nk52_evm9s564 gene=Nk52_evmTU9s564
MISDNCQSIVGLTILGAVTGYAVSGFSLIIVANYFDMFFQQGIYRHLKTASIDGDIPQPSANERYKRAPNTVTTESIVDRQEANLNLETPEYDVESLVSPIADTAEAYTSFFLGAVL